MEQSTPKYPLLRTLISKYGTIAGVVTIVFTVAGFMFTQLETKSAHDADIRSIESKIEQRYELARETLLDAFRSRRDFLQSQANPTPEQVAEIRLLSAQIRDLKDN